MDHDEKFLKSARLSEDEWLGLKQLARAVFEFEPLTKWMGLSPNIADRLVRLGLAEIGLSERYGKAFGACYRLTELGWKMFERGQRPRARRRRSLV
jgi:hypothetical protein